MKNYILLIFACTALSCSSEDVVSLEDCEALKAEINAEYDDQIQWVRDNTNPDDERQIGLINEERHQALETACD